MCTEKSLKDYNEWDRITTSLQHMASPKRRTMGMMVSFQRVWRWERSAHPGLAVCSSSSAPRVELLFGMSWILAPVLEHRLSAGVSKDQGDFTTILYFNFLFFFFYDVKRPPFPVWNKTFSLLFLLLTWIKELDLSFLLPSSVSSTHPSAWKSRLGTITEVINSCWAQSASRSLALASALCLLAVHPLPLSFSTRCFCLWLEFFLFFFPLSEGRNQKTNKVTIVDVDPSRVRREVVDCCSFICPCKAFRVARAHLC